MDVVVYSRGKCFKTTADYSNLESCTINVEEDCELEVESFDTEYNYDFLIVNSVPYSGEGISNGPDGVFVAEGEEIIFTSDISNTGIGFDICANPSTAPTVPSETDESFSTENLYYIIAGIVLFLSLLLIFTFCKYSKKKNNRQPQVVEGRQNRRLQADKGERDHAPKSEMLSQQSIEGAVEIGMIEPGIISQVRSEHVRDESQDSNLRPVFSFSENDVDPVPLFETDRAAKGGPYVDRKDEMPEPPAINLAPEATELDQEADSGPLADLPPPYYHEAPPEYQAEGEVMDVKEGARKE